MTSSRVPSHRANGTDRRNKFENEPRRRIFHPITVAVAGGAFRADDLDYEGPRVPGMIVGCETWRTNGKGSCFAFAG